MDDEEFWNNSKVQCFSFDEDDRVYIQINLKSD